MAESTRDKLAREMTHWQALDNGGRRPVWRLWAV